MSEPVGRLHEDVETLKTLRDELKVQVHLGALEAKERFEEAEANWHQLEDKLRSISRESGESLREVGQAARLLVDQIREAYRHIKDQAVK